MTILLKRYIEFIDEKSPVSRNEAGLPRSYLGEVITFSEIFIELTHYEYTR